MHTDDTMGTDPLAAQLTRNLASVTRARARGENVATWEAEIDEYAEMLHQIA